MQPIALPGQFPPTLVILAEEDRIISQAISLGVARQLNARIETLTGVHEHGFVVEHADKVAVLLRTWLNGV